MKDLRKVSKLQNVLDPNNLRFLSREIFAQDKYLEKIQKTLMAKLFFDLHLGFALIFKSQEDAELKWSLLKGCLLCLDRIIKDHEEFKIAVKDDKAYVVESLLNGDLIRKIIAKMESVVDDGETSVTKKLMVEIILRLNKIFQLLSNRQQELEFRGRDEIMDYIFSYVDIEHGGKFINQLARIKMRQLIFNPKTHVLVKDHGYSLFTDIKMFKTHFKKEFVAETDISVIIDKNTSPNSVNIRAEEGVSRFIDPDMYTNLDEDNLRTFVNFKKGQKVIIEYPVEHSIVKMMGSLKERSPEDEGAEANYFRRLDANELVNAKSLYAHSNHVMFITYQGEIYGMGEQIQGSEPGDEKLRKIKLPDKAVVESYKKAIAAKHFRLIVTDDGKLLF